MLAVGRGSRWEGQLRGVAYISLERWLRLASKGSLDYCGKPGSPDPRGSLERMRGPAKRCSLAERGHSGFPVARGSVES